MKKVMLIINPTSGGEKALDYKNKLENKAKDYFEHVETKITEKALDATNFASEASKEGYDAVLVFGETVPSMKLFLVLPKRTMFLSWVLYLVELVTSLQNFWRSIKTSMALLMNSILI